MSGSLLDLLREIRAQAKRYVFDRMPDGGTRRVVEVPGHPLWVLAHYGRHPDGTCWVRSWGNGGTIIDPVTSLPDLWAWWREELAAANDWEPPAPTPGWNGTTLVPAPVVQLDLLDLIGAGA